MKTSLLIALLLVSLSPFAKTRIVTINDNQSEDTNIVAVIGDTLRFVNNQSKAITLEFALDGGLLLFRSELLHPGAYYEHNFNTITYKSMYYFDTNSQKTFGNIVIYEHPIRISPKDTLLLKNKTNTVTVYYQSSQLDSDTCSYCTKDTGLKEIESNITLTFDNKTLYDGDLQKLMQSPLVSDNGTAGRWKYFIMTIPPNTLTEGDHLFQVKSSDDPINLFEEARFTVISIGP